MNLFLRKGKQTEQNVIDMTLQPSLLGEKRELALKLKQSIISSDTKHYLVIGVTGGGKTSSLTDFSDDYFIMYHECGTNKGKRRFSRFQDLNYIAMVNHFRNKESLNDRPRSVSITSKGRSQIPENNRIHAKRVALVDFLCRYAELFQLLNVTQGKLTSKQYYFHQHLAKDTWTRKLLQRSCVFSENF